MYIKNMNFIPEQLYYNHYLYARMLVGNLSNYENSELFSILKVGLDFNIGIKDSNN